MNLSPNAIRVLDKRYLKKDKDGRVIERPEDMFRRVAKNIASADLIYDHQADIEEIEEKFYRVMANMDFLPNSPTLMNAGRELQQLSACFVLPIEDSMESIFETIKNTAMIHKSGGGTGFSFSRLRPANSPVATTNGVSSGPISFMKVFDSATEAIKQGGTRRGANMAILRVDHPDILDFISCKEDNHRFNNFNISVAVTVEFMECVEKNEMYNLINPHTRKIEKRVPAREIFDSIVRATWKNGEPGIIFLDRINMGNPTPKIGEIESTNPCGEQPLLPYESCNLGSINLSKMVKELKSNELTRHLQLATRNSPTHVIDGAQKLCSIDYEKLSRVVYTAVHFLDNVIDKNKYPLKEIEEMTKGNRKIGLGVMGFADMLILLGIPYNSDEAIGVAKEVMSFISDESKKASALLAEQRGTFPNFHGSIYDSVNVDVDVKDNYPHTHGAQNLCSTHAHPHSHKLRNATTTTIAPTGTLSIIANCSSGIEPIFAVSYVRHVMDNDELIEVHPEFERIAKERGFYSKELMKKIARKGDLYGISGIPEDVCRLFVTAHNITPTWHVKMQSIFQRYTDNAVSKTVNFLHDTSVEGVREVYMQAYRMGCKGITIYRDGSRDKQVLNVETRDEGRERKDEGRGTNLATRQLGSLTAQRITPRPRPKVTKGTTQRIETGCGNLYVTINECDKGLPFEIFTRMGKAGGCAASQSEAIGRLVSLALRSNIEPEAIARQLTGISCHLPSWENGDKILSCSDAIGKAIDRYLIDRGFKSNPALYDSAESASEGRTQISYNIYTEQAMHEVCTGQDLTPNRGNIGHAQDLHGTRSRPYATCPDCGNILESADNCLFCRSCGYSKCS
ncbi:MAG: vitamin B12-dependent ribonucleotide reductase [Nitrospinae bacterium]|nr:vitamin B12-dependent ribonucleotide reductase [Nitrospinota bacterium]